MDQTPNTRINPGPHSSHRRPAEGWLAFLPPALVYGFGMAVTLWCVWFLQHVPGVSLPQAIAAEILLAGQLIAAIAVGVSATRLLGPGSAIKVGALSGLIAAGVNLLLLGSTVKNDVAAPGVIASQKLLVAAPGFFVLGGVVGIIGGLVGRAIAKKNAGEAGPRRAVNAHLWLGRFAIVAAVAFLPLLLVGGLVTSTQSGMAVPDWPTTKGMNMFLYPLGAMTHPRVVLEHSHRLFGSMVGLTTLVLMIFVLVVERRAWYRVWAVAVFIGVTAQGILGGFRVLENNPMLAAVHGVFAQIIFAMAVTLATRLSWLYQSDWTTVEGDRKRRAMGTAMLHSMVVQLLLGAAYRHLGHKHILFTHAAFAVLILIMTVMAALLAMKRRQQAPGQDGMNRALTAAGRTLLGLVFLQFALGWVAFLVVLSNPSGPVPTADQLDTARQVPFVRTLVTTAHQTNGALLFGVATVTAVLCRRLSPRRGAKTEVA